MVNEKARFSSEAMGCRTQLPRSNIIEEFLSSRNIINLLGSPKIDTLVNEMHEFYDTAIAHAEASSVSCAANDITQTGMYTIIYDSRTKMMLSLLLRPANYIQLERIVPVR